MRSTANLSAMTIEQIAEEFRIGGFSGFSGETCHKCKSTTNMMFPNPGYVCQCGEYNATSWSCGQIPHDHPQYGPSLADIQAGARQSGVFPQ